MKENDRSINVLQQGLRVGMKLAVAPIFPREIHDTEYPFQEGNGIERALELQKKGYGLLFDISHFGYSDLPQAFAATDFGVKEMLGKKLLIGGAAHQIKPGITTLGRLNGVEIAPIVTEDTIKDAIEKGKDTTGLVLHEGLANFTKKATDYLANGQHVLLAGQGGRRPTLFPTPNEDGETPKLPITLGTFFLSATRHNTTRFAYMPIGLAIIGECDYSKKNVGKYNLFREYRITRGLTFTYEEIMKAVDGNFRKIDEYLTCMKANLVPEAYVNVFDEEAPFTPNYSI